MDTIAEFQARRREAWRRIKYSVVIMLTGFAILFIFCVGAHSEATPRFWICGVAFAAVAIAIGHMAFTWKRMYRCPACEMPIMNRLSEGGDVPLNPRECPNCGAKLR